MVLVAYARVSTEDQSTDSQMLALRQAGCSVIFEEHASGGDRDGSMSKPGRSGVVRGAGGG